MVAPTIAVPGSPEALFRYAEAYAEASDILSRDQYRREPDGSQLHVTQAAHTAPTTVLDALALEVYLKALYSIDYGKPAWGHKCCNLFMSLRPGTQDAVRYHYSLQVESDHKIIAHLRTRHPDFDISFDHCISLANDNFTKMRYLFEGSKGKMFCWPLLRKAVRGTILSIKPEFANL